MRDLFLEVLVRTVFLEKQRVKLPTLKLYQIELYSSLYAIFTVLHKYCPPLLNHCQYQVDISSKLS